MDISTENFEVKSEVRIGIDEIGMNAPPVPENSLVARSFIGIGERIFVINSGFVRGGFPLFSDVSDRRRLSLIPVSDG
jgi:hypothetical protein